MKNVMSVISNFVFYYPLLMAYLWMVGGLLHYLLIERKGVNQTTVGPLPSYPKVSVVMPCYNEADNVREVIACLDELNYPNYNIIAINDGSHDETGTILNELVNLYPKLVVVHQHQNEG